MRLLSWTLIGGLILTGMAGVANADFIIAHQGSTNPLTEGFGTFTFGPASTAGPLANDLGLPAWRITGSDRSSQFAEASGALTPAQKADIAAHGFLLTMVSRAIQGLALPYDSVNHITIADAHVDTGIRRFEIALGLDANGDTVAVLATSVDNGGTGSSVRTPGPSYTLAGSGYHIYQLAYNPGTQLADLFIDGIDRIQGYGGHTSFVGDRGLLWGAVSGGQGNFNFVELESSGPKAVPEPSTLVLLGMGLVGFVAWRRWAFWTVRDRF